MMRNVKVFRLDEYSNYDATATVLEISGYSSLYWIGHSQVRNTDHYYEINFFREL